MTNRARPTWPEGAADGGPSATPASPASNGRSPQNGQTGPKSATQQRSANGQRPGEIRPQPAQSGRPGSQGRPQSASPAAATGGRPAAQQQPPVRSTPSAPGFGSQSAYGQPQAGKAAEKSGGSFAERVSAAKNAVLDKANAVKEAAVGDRADKTDPKDADAYQAAGAGPAVDEPAQYRTSDFGRGGDLGQAAELGRPGARFEPGQGGLAGTGGVIGTGVAGAGTTTVAAPGAPATTADAEPAGRTKPQVRKARLRITRVDPWSVMKTSFLLAIAFGIVIWIAVYIVWIAIEAAGVFENINRTVTEVLGNPNGEPFQLETYISRGKVMGFTTLLACADVLIITALATLGSFLYNIAATLLGGLEVTLASED